MRVPLNDTGGAFTCLHFAYSAGAICPRLRRDSLHAYIKVLRVRVRFFNLGATKRGTAKPELRVALIRLPPAGIVQLHPAEYGRISFTTASLNALRTFVRRSLINKY